MISPNILLPETCTALKKLKADQATIRQHCSKCIVSYQLYNPHYCLIVRVEHHDTPCHCTPHIAAAMATGTSSCTVVESLSLLGLGVEVRLSLREIVHSAWNPLQTAPHPLDPFRKGATIVLGVTGKELWPSQALVRYLQVEGENPRPTIVEEM